MSEQHSTEQGTPGLNTSLIVVIGTVSTLFVIFLVVAFTAVYEYETRKVDEQKRVNAPVQALEQLRSQQLTEISGYRWVDEQGRIAAIPIERAMKLVAERNRQQP